MSAMSLVSWTVRPTDIDHSHITDLALHTAGTKTYLLASTRYDGTLSSFVVNDDSLSLRDTAAYQGGDRAGSTGSIGFVSTATGTAVLTGGGAAGGLQLQGLNSTGQLATPQALPGTAQTVHSGLVFAETITLASGAQAVFGGIAGQGGIGRLLLDANGDLKGSFFSGDTSFGHAGHITDLASLTKGGVTYLFTLSDTDTGLSAWAVSAAGGLSHANAIAPDTGLWVSAPSALATAQVAGQSFVIVAGAGSNSLSVIQVGVGGTLQVADHVIDDLSTRFAGVAALETVVHHGQTFVIAGGADDGISLYLMLPGGRLLARGHLADTTGMGLADISAITAQSSGDGIDIFVASASEHGLTRLRYDTGPAGERRSISDTGGTLTGTAGDDVLLGGRGSDLLQGGNGDDILRDGAGSDTLVGGGGADVFIFDADGTNDTVQDFSFGIDRVDLSGWPMLRSLDQLALTALPNGVRITYGTETLTLRSANGKPIDPDLLSFDDLIGGVHIPRIIRPGFSDSTPVTPALPDAPVYTPPVIRQSIDPNPETASTPPVGTSGTTGGGAGPNGGGTGGTTGGGTPPAQPSTRTLMGTDAANSLTGSGVIDYIYGLGGDDMLAGWGNNDLIWGSGGADKLYGNDGNDALFGGSGADILDGGNGNDMLKGQSGNDRLIGGKGADKLLGGGGADQLDGGKGHDALKGGGGKDAISGGGGRDKLVGQGKNDTLAGGGGKDTLEGGNGKDKLSGGGGNDRIDGGKGSDVLTGGGGRDQFVFTDGRDTITDFDLRKDGLSLDDRLWSGRLDADDVVAKFGHRAGGDIVLDFGRGDVLTLTDLTNLGALADQIAIF